ADEGIAARVAELEAARSAEQDRLDAEEAERARVEAERVEAERRAAEEAERARIEVERLEAERETQRAEAEQRAAQEAQRAAQAQAERDAAARDSSDGGSGGGSGGSGNGASGPFKNCTAARDAGAAPVYRGQPGYASHLDRDGDGVGCEN